MSTVWLDAALADLPEPGRPAARLALLAALAPYRLTDADVAAWRAASPGATDADVVQVLAFGAFAAVERVARWITVADDAVARSIR